MIKLCNFNLFYRFNRILNSLIVMDFLCILGVNFVYFILFFFYLKKNKENLMKFKLWDGRILIEI